MKKLLIFASLILCILGLSACQKEQPQLDATEKLEIEDVASMQIKEIEKTYAMEAPVTSNTVTLTSTNLYYDVKMEFTNLGSEELSIEDDFTYQLSFEDQTPTTYVKIEGENRTELLESYKIQPNETVLLHVYSRYDITQTNVTKDTKLSFTKEDDTYTFLDLNADAFTPEKNYVEYGGKIETSEGITIDIEECLVEKQIYPSNPEGTLVQGYRVRSSNTSFVMLKLAITNGSNADKEIKEIVGFRTFEEDSAFTHEAGMVIAETPDGKKLLSDGAIKAGEKCTVYCMISASNDKVDDIEEFRLDTMDGSYYIKK